MFFTRASGLEERGQRGGRGTIDGVCNTLFCPARYMRISVLCWIGSGGGVSGLAVVGRDKLSCELPGIMRSAGCSVDAGLFSG